MVSAHGRLRRREGLEHEPYIGAGEFYLEYGKFDVTLTVPFDYIVAATGELRNPEEVLTAAQRERLARAKTSPTPIAIIGDEAGTGATRPETVGTQVWHFSADNVRDFAFAAAPDFRWDASGYDGILIETFYRPSRDKLARGEPDGARGDEVLQRAVDAYPYSQTTTVEGPIEGMEYPMLTFDPAGPSREEQQWVVAHEIGHEWFPMVVGVNERLYPWMDEGFNTFIDLANAAKYFAGTPYGDTIEVHPLHLYRDHAVAGKEQPLITRPVESRDLFWTGYQKPALMMQIAALRGARQGRFDPAFRDYMRTWAFKHPTPSDFFRIMRDKPAWSSTGSGATGSTARRGPTSRWRRSTTARRAPPSPSSARARCSCPSCCRLTFSDGSVENVKLPVEAWNLGPIRSSTG